MARAQISSANKLRSKLAKGGLKGMVLSPDMVAEWIDSFPITAYISDTKDHIYPGAADSMTINQVSEKDERIGPHDKEEGQKIEERDGCRR